MEGIVFTEKKIFTPHIPLKNLDQLKKTKFFELFFSFLFAKKMQTSLHKSGFTSCIPNRMKDPVSKTSYIK